MTSYCSKRESFSNTSSNNNYTVRINTTIVMVKLIKEINCSNDNYAKNGSRNCDTNLLKTHQFHICFNTFLFISNLILFNDLENLSIVNKK